VARGDPHDETDTNDNHGIAPVLRRLARRKAVSPAQIALAWLLAQRPWLVPIPGTTDIDRLADNVASAELILTESDISEVGAAPIEHGSAD
jgi:aryl-alcohol dehydrogenase-like predicted oxidoreductase